MTESKSKAKSPKHPQTDLGDLTHVYTLIYSFLEERSHTKAAARALKKAVNGVITLDDSTVHDGPTLQKILEEWRQLKAAAGAINAPSSDSGSDSSDESSSDDDGGRETNLARKRTGKSNPSDSSGSLDPFFASNHTFTYLDSDDDTSGDSDGTPQKAVTRITNLKEHQRDSSKTLSSADDADSDEEPTSGGNDSDSSDDSDVDMDSSTVPGAKARSKKKTFQVKKPDTSSSDATSSSSSSSDSDSNEDVQPPSKSKHKAKSDSSSDSSSSSDEDSDEDTEVPTTKKSERNAASSSSSDSGSSSSGSSGSSSSSSESEDELAETPVPSAIPDPDARATKKRRANEEGTAVITATAKIPAGDARTSKASRKPNVPFQRVNVQAAKFHDEKLKDNSFESRGARPDDYGARANRDLVVTRGDGFRKEKNKKKRGSYRGGDITLQSHSFKFED